MRRDQKERAESARGAGRRMSRGLLLLAATVLATGCALFFKSPKVSIADVRVATVGLVGGTAEVQLSVINPNGFELVAREFRYRLSYSDDDADQGWRMLTEGESEEQVVVAPNDSASVRLTVPFRYSDVGRALG